MKKVFFAFVAVATLALVSCNNNAATEETKTEETAPAAEETAATEEAADSAAEEAPATEAAPAAQ